MKVDWIGARPGDVFYFTEANANNAEGKITFRCACKGGAIIYWCCDAQQNCQNLARCARLECVVEQLAPCCVCGKCKK